MSSMASILYSAEKDKIETAISNLKDYVKMGQKVPFQREYAIKFYAIHRFFHFDAKTVSIFEKEDPKKLEKLRNLLESSFDKLIKKLDPTEAEIEKAKREAEKSKK